MNFFKKLFGSRSPEKQKKPTPVKIDLEQEFQKAMQLLSKFKRTAYVPVTVKTDGEAQFSSVSKIGGLPYLRTKTIGPSVRIVKRTCSFFYN